MKLLDNNFVARNVIVIVRVPCDREKRRILNKTLNRYMVRCVQGVVWAVVYVTFMASTFTQAEHQ